MNEKLRVMCVCGARPNFMKVAPLVRAFRKSGQMDVSLVHTGQHYDAQMSGAFFRDLAMPEPDINLEVGSLPHATQTGEIMRRFEPVCGEMNPDWVVVVGDVNSTFAAAFVAAGLGKQVAHVEAGLRSFDRSMPEELNRMLTDSISDALFVTEESAVKNLLREGVSVEKIHRVGNVMIDSLRQVLPAAKNEKIVQELGLQARGYALATLHRASNVDDAVQLRELMNTLREVAKRLPVVIPAHPRLQKSLERLGIETGNVRLIAPLGYLAFVKLMADAAIVLTDSGGVQEETSVLGVPCLTLRANTERPVTVWEGTNRLVGTEKEGILLGLDEELMKANYAPRVPALWDGKAAERIAAILLGLQQHEMYSYEPAKGVLAGVT